MKVRTTNHLRTFPANRFLLSSTPDLPPYFRGAETLRKVFQLASGVWKSTIDTGNFDHGAPGRTINVEYLGSRLGEFLGELDCELPR